LADELMPMHFHLNLRSDLGKLSDAELVERLEAAWQAYESVKRPSRFWLWWAPLWRGPVRHPRAYRFLSMLGQGVDDWFGLLLAGVLSAEKMEPFLRRNHAIDTHLTLNEIRDLTDEVERRVARRNRAS
jgi:hypothetical protein